MLLLFRTLRQPQIQVLWLLLLLSIPDVQAQKRKGVRSSEPPPECDNSVFLPSIRTPQLYRDQNQLSYPILEVGKPGQLHLHFDELSTQIRQFSVRIVHCTPDWRPSSLLPMDYYQGFIDAPLRESQVSRNTLIPYIHYHYSFPQPGEAFLHSGNYVIQVRTADRAEQLVLARRFVVAEPLVRIAPDLGLSPNVAGRRMLQSVNFNVFPGSINLNDAFSDTRVCVLQNFRWDTRRCNLRPTYIYPERMEYRFDAANDFPGGNEYRFFDLRNVQRMGGRLRQLTLTDSGTFAQLEVDKPRGNKVYFSEPDFNGNFFIGLRQLSGTELEADYVHVRFLLESKTPVPVGGVYVFGALSDWKIDPRFRLNYDSQGYYYRDILLKQGIYNYHFVVHDPSFKSIDETHFEGSHFETENTYTFLIYLKSPADREHRIVGFHHINYYD